MADILLSAIGHLLSEHEHVNTRTPILGSTLPTRSIEGERKADVEQVNKTGPYSVEFMLVSGQAGHKVKAQFTLASQPPHRFVGLGFQPVDEGRRGVI